MTNPEFSGYRSSFTLAVRQVLASERSDALSEAAFPAYSHPNPVIRALFWERIRRVAAHVAAHPPRRALDFGCGSGVMLPFLAASGGAVTAVDPDFGPLRALEKRWPRTGGVVFVEGDHSALAGLDEGSFDLVLALDVLEHVEDLPAVLERLCALLAPGGEILVSGPTENVAYRVGRWLAGPEYTGDYHVRGVAEIRDALARHVEVSTMATLVPLLPLFKIYRGVKRGDSLEAR